MASKLSDPNLTACPDSRGAEGPSFPVVVILGTPNPADGLVLTEADLAILASEMASAKAQITAEEYGKAKEANG